MKHSVKAICVPVLVCGLMFGSLLSELYLIKKQKDLSFVYSQNQILKQEQELLKKKVSRYQDLLDASKIEKVNMENKFSFVVPEQADFSSLLIFLEEYALLNDVTVSKIDLHKDKEGGVLTKLDITYRPVSIEVWGKYTNVMCFLSDIQNNMGVANYIDNIVLQGTNGETVSWNGRNEEDENVVAHFQIYLGFKKKEGDSREQTFSSRH